LKIDNIHDSVGENVGVENGADLGGNVTFAIMFVRMMSSNGMEGN
jgi:hypothetical protein